jgi:hypothetical protein
MNQATYASLKWDTLAAVARYIEAHGKRSVPIENLDSELRPLVSELVEAGALVEDAGNIGFFHDTLYDYVLAKLWADSSIDLATSLGATDQDLSHRSLVRQVLTYQQGADRDGYSRSLSSLLFGDIRNHIKDVAFAVLRSDPFPDASAWSVVERLVESPGNWTDYIVDVLSQPGWFQYADREGAILLWAIGKEQSTRSMMASVLSNAGRQYADRVATMLSALLPVQSWRNQLPGVIVAADSADSDRYVDLIADAITDGLFDDSVRFTTDMFLYPLVRRKERMQDADYRVLGALIDRWYNLALVTGRELRDVVGRNYLISEFITDSANYSALRYLRAVLPATCALLTKLRDANDEPFRQDPWSLMYLSSIQDPDDLIFWKMADTLKVVAVKTPDSLTSLETRLVEVDWTNSGRFWLYSAWSANASHFCERALAYISEDPSRLRCGYADSPYWMTRELVAAIHHQLPPDNRRRLENIILDYVPEWERSPRGRRFHGQAQYEILSGLRVRNLSDAAKRRLQELERKFVRPRSPSPIEAGFVPSPIPAEQTRLMSDEQWLNAMRRYSTEEREDWTKGGAHELAATLEAEARDEPVRFAKLAVRLPDDVNEAYPSAILRALGDVVTERDAEVVYQVVRRIHHIPGRPCGLWIGKPLARLADCDIPEDVFGILNWYATEAADPTEEVWKPGPRSAEGFYGGDPLTAGINSVRGAMAETVSALVWHSAARISKLHRAIDSLTVDPVSSVRSCAALLVLSVAKHDGDLGYQLFLQLIDHHESRYLGTWPIERAVSYFGEKGRSGLHRVIRRMLASDDDTTKRAGGRQSMLMLLRHARAGPARLALRSGSQARAGMAEVAAANITYEPWHAQCVDQLQRDFFDKSDEVRAAAAQWVGRGAALDRTNQEFVLKFIESPAYIEDPSYLLRALDESVRVPVDIVLAAVEKVIELRMGDLQDMRTGLRADANIMSKLLMRAYASAPDIKTKIRSLDLIDRLILVPGSGMRQGVQAYV